MSYQPSKSISQTKRRCASASASASASSSLVTTKKSPSRKFFHNVEPTFFVVTPKTQEFQFLDNSDSSKNTLVRKKAREWVHRNKQQELVVKTKRTEIQQKVGEAEFEIQRERAGELHFEMVGDPLMNLAAGRPDPFETFPKVGRKIDHIIEYSCPEQVPCSDDKYAWRPRQQQIQPSRKNSVMGVMAEDYVSFVLWLYATTLMRDGITGRFVSEEALYFYKLSLKSMQTAVSQPGVEYSDTFICSLACFTACANFAGMFEAAEMHCDAMFKSITLRGQGDMMAGFLQYRPFTRKVIQWCEFGVSAQNRALPKVPYTPPPLTDPPPYSMLLEIARLTSVTLSSIPPVSGHFNNLFRMMHQLSTVQANSPSAYGVLPSKTKINPSVIQPLYDMECVLLGMLATQQTPGHEYSKLDVMLTEACQLFFWIGPRGLPTEMKLCDRLVAWLKTALVQLLDHFQTPHGLSLPEILQSPQPKEKSVITESALKREDSAVHIISTPRTLDNAMLWALYLGTIASSPHSRPEYPWYHEQLQLRIQTAGLKSQEELKEVLRVFPSMDRFHWIDIRRLGIQYSK